MTKGRGTSFEDRLARIQTGGPNTMGEVHIGPTEDRRARSKTASTVRVKKKKKVKPKDGSNMLVVPVALIIGALCMFAGKVAAYHLFGEGLFPVAIPVPALEPYVVYAPFVIAGILAILFAWTFEFNSLKRKIAVMVGLAVVFVFEGDLIERFPSLYTAMYSEEYVANAPAPKLDEMIARAQEQLKG